MLNKQILLSKIQPYQNIFFTKEYKNIDNETELNIILSPEFYWTRKIKLPVANEKDAKSLIKPIFEEIFGELENYDFMAIGLPNGEFLGIAYEPKKIAQFLIDANIKLARVNAIYFAVIECQMYDKFIFENKIYSYKDGVLLNIPTSISNEIEKINELDLDSIFFSKYKLNLNYSNKYISNKMMYILSFICLCIGILYLWQGIIFANQASMNTTKIDSIKTTNNLPSSKMQLESIVLQMQNDFNLQGNIRKELAYILDYSIISEHQSKIDSLEFQNGSYKIVFSNLDEQNAKTYFSSKFKTINVKNRDSKFEVELTNEK